MALLFIVGHGASKDLVLTDSWTVLVLSQTLGEVLESLLCLSKKVLVDKCIGALDGSLISMVASVESSCHPESERSFLSKYSRRGQLVFDCGRGRSSAECCGGVEADRD